LKSIIPASEPVETCFGIVDIAPVAEGAGEDKVVGKGGIEADELAPCIVLVFYNKAAAHVNKVGACGHGKAPLHCSGAGQVMG